MNLVGTMSTKVFPGNPMNLVWGNVFIRRIPPEFLQDKIQLMTHSLRKLKTTYSKRWEAALKDSLEKSEFSSFR